MEEKNTEKKVWESPDVEVINTKMTNGGAAGYCSEDGRYYDNNDCGYGS